MKLNRKSYLRFREDSTPLARNQHQNINNRLFVFALVMVFGMVILFARFYYIQIIRNDDFAQRLEIFTRRLVRINAPRGEIIDRNGVFVASNVEQLEITFMPPQRFSEANKMELARRFAQVFDMNVALLSRRDLQDLYLYLNPAVINEVLTASERDRFIRGEMNEAQRLAIVLSRIDDVKLATLNENDKATWLVRTLLEVPTGGRPKIIKTNVTAQEVAFLAENSHLFPGFDVRISWARSFPLGATLRPVVGSISTAIQGVPLESVLYYLANDYMRNDIVGRSGIELFYESVLRGEPSVYDLTHASDGSAKLTEVKVGRTGDTLRLSFDAKWQQFAEETIQRIFSENMGRRERRFMDVIDVTVMDVNTGDVLVMASVAKGENGFILNPMSNILNAYVVGSAVKGATVYMGLDQEVIRMNEIIVDQPLRIRDTPLKRSFRDLGPINDLKAISQSSNVYMFHIAMRLGGATYVPDGPLPINPQAFQTMRNYFSQFGLGTPTQIDLPNEQVGFSGTATLPGLLLEFAIGQYDTYTPIQLAQYASTIANGGKRIAPRVMLNSIDSQSGNISYVNPVRVLNILDNNEAITRVQAAFRDCVVNELCRPHLGTLGAAWAGKTGTAETNVRDENDTWIRSHNSTLVTFGPYEQPQVATSCVARHAWVEQPQSNICQLITAEILRFRFP